MTTAKASPAAASSVDGYWTIEIISQDRSRQGDRYVCHAQDDGHAKSIAGHLAGSARTTVGYDYHRIDNPAGRYARALTVGQSERIDDSGAWTALSAARRGG
jgi:hypothetical protein